MYWFSVFFNIFGHFLGHFWPVFGHFLQSAEFWANISKILWAYAQIITDYMGLKPKKWLHNIWTASKNIINRLESTKSHKIIMYKLLSYVTSRKLCSPTRTTNSVPRPFSHWAFLIARKVFFIDRYAHYYHFSLVNTMSSSDHVAFRDQTASARGFTLCWVQLQKMNYHSLDVAICIWLQLTIAATHGHSFGLASCPPIMRLDILSFFSPQAGDIMMP